MKVRLVPHEALSSKTVRRKCQNCNKKAAAELVDYGKGGKLLFCICGSIKEVKKQPQPKGESQ